MICSAVSTVTVYLTSLNGLRSDPASTNTFSAIFHSSYDGGTVSSLRVVMTTHIQFMDQTRHTVKVQCSKGLCQGLCE